MTNLRKFKDRDDYLSQLWNATQFEQRDRAAAFLGVNESIGEFEVRPLTLWHYTALTLINSPFIPPFDTPTDLQIVEFLWLLSPEYSLNNKRGRARLVKRCRQFVLPDEPFFKTKKAMLKWESDCFDTMLRIAKLIGDKDTPERGTIRGFVSNSLADRPASRSTGNWEPDYYSDTCAICAALAREYRFTESEVMHMPMNKIFQYLKERKWFNEEKPVLFNPSSVLTSRWLDQCNAEARKN